MCDPDKRNAPHDYSVLEKQHVGIKQEINYLITTVLNNIFDEKSK